MFLAVVSAAAAAPQVVPYIHEEIPAEPYVHEEIAAVPYVHIEPQLTAEALGEGRPNQYAGYPQAVSGPVQYTGYAAGGCRNNLGQAVKCAF